MQVHPCRKPPITEEDTHKAKRTLCPMEVREPDEGLSFPKESPEISFWICAGGGDNFVNVYACVTVAAQLIRQNKENVFLRKIFNVFQNTLLCTSSSAAHLTPLCRRMLGLNHGRRNFKDTNPLCRL